MKIAYFTPAYRSQVTLETMSTVMVDVAFAGSNGWSLLHLGAARNGIALARNWAVASAVKADCDYLYSIDADCSAPIPISPLGRLMSSSKETGATIIGAAIILRGNDRMNCEPARPGEVYEAESVGGGITLVNLRQLCTLDKPVGEYWYSHEMAPNGYDTAVGEDVHFCRQVRKYGGTVYVDYSFATEHNCFSSLSTSGFFEAEQAAIAQG